MGCSIASAVLSTSTVRSYVGFQLCDCFAIGIGCNRSSFILTVSYHLFKFLTFGQCPQIFVNIMMVFIWYFAKICLRCAWSIFWRILQTYWRCRQGRDRTGDLPYGFLGTGNVTFAPARLLHLAIIAKTEHILNLLWTQVQTKGLLPHFIHIMFLYSCWWYVVSGWPTNIVTAVAIARG